jgi:glycine/D-amino acid oxidase-like deaminating enzyme
MHRIAARRALLGLAGASAAAALYHAGRTALADCRFTPSELPSTPFWLQSKRWRAPAEVHTSAELPAEIDVVVIGAGLSGAGCTLALAERGVPTLLLDARGVSGGASGRNGGFLGGATWLQLPVMLVEQELRHAVETIQLVRFNLDYIRRFCADHGVDADLDEGVDGVQFFSSKAALDERLGWWRHVRRLLPLVGVEVLEGEVELAAALRLRPGATLDSHGAVCGAATCLCRACRRYGPRLCAVAGAAAARLRHDLRRATRHRGGGSGRRGGRQRAHAHARAARRAGRGGRRRHARAHEPRRRALQARGRVRQRLCAGRAPNVGPRRSPSLD